MKNKEIGKLATKSFAKRLVRIMLIMVASLLCCVIILTGLLMIISPGKPEPFLDGNKKPLAGSISEKIKVTVGGVEQGMIIKGRSTNNPVLLFMHGGPGMPEYFLAEKYPTGLEDYFTVCYWEQRGAGLSYNGGASPEAITTEQLVSDTIEVTNYLRERFGQEKIYLMAHSWGSFPGIQAAAKAPELYYSYIGIGQITKMFDSERRAYEYMLEKYTAAGDTAAIKKLKNYPVLESDTAARSFFVSLLRDETMHELGIGTMHNMKSIYTGVFIPVFQSRAYTLGEKTTVWRAKAFLRNKTVLLDELFAFDAADKVPRLEIPAYFMSGRYDYTVNYDLSKEYLSCLQAPEKGFYTFEESAHSPMFEEPERFMQIMLNDVLNAATSLSDAE